MRWRKIRRRTLPVKRRRIVEVKDRAIITSGIRFACVSSCQAPKVGACNQCWPLVRPSRAQTWINDQHWKVNAPIAGDCFSLSQRPFALTGWAVDFA